MSTPITPSQLKDSYFGDMPEFPSITGPVGFPAVDTTNGYVSTAPLPNKIYHNRREHYSNLKRIDPNTFDEVIEKAWVIPFTVDSNLPVSEITERIDKAMDKIGLYNYWKINYNDYTIIATEKIKAELK